jgi:hypothetical protein
MPFAETIYPSSENTSIFVITPAPSNEKTAASFPIVRILKKIDFLLFSSCFWCASDLNMRNIFRSGTLIPESSDRHSERY